MLSSRVMGTPDRMATSVVLALALTFPRASSAQSDPADVRFEQGRVLRRERRDADALAHFEALYRDTHQPRALAQVALAEAALGRWAVAEAHLATALAQPDAWVTANRAAGVNLDQQAALIASHLGSVEVTCAAPGAEVWVDGRRVEALPLARPLRFEAGRVALEVRAPGFQPERRELALAAGQTAREALTLRPAAPASVQVAGGEAPRAEGGGARRTLAWVSAGGALVFFGVGVAGYVVASSAADRWNDDARCLRPGLTREQVCGDEASTARTMNALGVVGLVGGVALAATSVALFVTSGRARSPAALACGPSFGAPGVACAARF